MSTRVATAFLLVLFVMLFLCDLNIGLIILLRLVTPDDIEMNPGPTYNIVKLVKASFQVGRALLTICPATLVEEKKTVRKAPASSQGSFLLLYYPIFSFFCLVILFLCLSNFTNTVFVEFLTNKHF